MNADNDKHISDYVAARNETLMKLIKSAAAREQWHKYSQDNDPLYSAVIDLGRANQLPDAEITKLLAVVYSNNLGSEMLAIINGLCVESMRTIAQMENKNASGS